MRLRKSLSQKKAPKLIQKGNLVLNTQLMKASVRSVDGDRFLDLTGKEFRILSFLAQNEGQPFSRSELVKAIWENSTHVLDRTVDSHVCALRRKLGPDLNYIECVSGVGYRFTSQAVPERLPYPNSSYSSQTR